MLDWLHGTVPSHHTTWPPLPAPLCAETVLPWQANQPQCPVLAAVGGDGLTCLLYYLPHTAWKENLSMQ